MFIVIDSRIPVEAKLKLKQYGQVIEIYPTSITYESICAHPDIFICQLEKELIVAPNSSPLLIEQLLKKSIPFQFGFNKIGNPYPLSCSYNAVVTDLHCVHLLKQTDGKILELSKNKQQIRVNQGYTRCNLIYLGNQEFISSDVGITKLVEKHDESVFLLSNEGIVLPGMKHGFFAGCCGFVNQTLFVLGRLDYHPKGNELKLFLKQKQIDCIELYDGPLFDGGSILFV